MNKKILLANLYIIFLTANHVTYGDPTVERPCTKSDMLGTWEISSSKGKYGAEDIFPDLVAPYQLRIYKSDGEYRQGSINNIENKDKLLAMMNFSQDETFEVNDGVVTTFDRTGKILEQYGCSYFYKDFPEGKIKKGTLSLLWYRKNEPFGLNTYTKILNKP